jgi:hypothetical protein
MAAEEVADCLGVTARWVYNEARAGRLPHIKLGRYVKVPPGRNRRLAGDNRTRRGRVSGHDREVKMQGKRRRGTGSLLTLHGAWCDERPMKRLVLIATLALGFAGCAAPDSHSNAPTSRDDARLAKMERLVSQAKSGGGGDLETGTTIGYAYCVRAEHVSERINSTRLASSAWRISTIAPVRTARRGTRPDDARANHLRLKGAELSPY